MTPDASAANARASGNLRVLFGLVVGITLAACSINSEEAELADFAPAVRQTVNGAVAGLIDAPNEAISWKGIPYAAPPVGELRWKAPRDPASWEGVLDASRFKDPCTQHGGTPDWAILETVTGSEDCLYLNIWRPDTDEENLPVFYWIHGGGNFTGNAFTDFSALAQRMNVVAVAVGYRLGPLGYISHPALQTGQGLDNASNYGLLDQIQGLKWVRENIAAFGGAPDNVTVAGESAGAGNVLALMTSPLTKDLFHKSIIQSLGEGVETREVAEARGKRMERSLSARTPVRKPRLEGVREMLYEAKAEEILLAFNRGLADNRDWDLNHIVDGIVIRRSYPAAIASGDYRQVPVIIGYNERELGSLLVVVSPRFPGDPEFAKGFELARGRISPDDLFDTKEQRRIFEQAQKHGSDMYGAMVNAISEALAAQQPGVFAYRFAFGEREGVLPTAARYALGAAHAAELPFVFGSDVDFVFGLTFTAKNEPGRQKLQSTMMDYWGGFMHRGNPNRPGLPEWKPWLKGNPRQIVFDASHSDSIVSMTSEVRSMQQVSESMRGLDDDIGPNVENVVLNYFPGMWLYGY